ncbi:DUF362 domain-containing protein [bacterium]|nr:DUF362 domain-containing protein [bacterium]
MAKHQIAYAKSNTYDDAAVAAALAASLALVGGWSAHLPAAPARVLVKPNMLANFAPEEVVTTHPAVLRAVLTSLREAGYTPFVGDSPAGSTRKVETVWKKTGIGAVCEELGVELVSFEAAGHRTLRGKNRFARELHIANPVIDADAVVNLPKLKTHSLTVFTCAVKNLFGYVPGMRKMMLHGKALNPRDFAEILTDVYRLRPPNLNIVDGIISMQGDGPSGGSPYPFGRIIVGSNAPALDHSLASRIGIPAERMPVERVCLQRGYFQIDEIEELGDVPEVKQDYEIPGNSWVALIPGPFGRYVAEQIRTFPVIRQKDCIRCGACARACPHATIPFEDGEYHIDHAACISCLCCHEVCPVQAIELSGSWPIQIYNGIKKLKRLFKKPVEEKSTVLP